MQAPQFQDPANTNIHDAQNISYICSNKISFTYGSLSNFDSNTSTNYTYANIYTVNAITLELNFFRWHEYLTFYHLNKRASPRF